MSKNSIKPWRTLLFTHQELKSSVKVVKYFSKSIKDGSSIDELLQALESVADGSHGQFCLVEEVIYRTHNDAKP